MRPIGTTIAGMARSDNESCFLMLELPIWTKYIHSDIMNP